MAGTATLPGTETPPDAPRETLVAVDALLFKETVQVELPLLLRLDGVQTREVTWSGGTKLTVTVRFVVPLPAVIVEL